MSRHVATFVIDQSTLIREGLVRILAGTRFRVSAAYSKLQEIGKKVGQGGHVLVLLGSNAWPDDDFSELRHFKLEHEHVKIVVLSESCNPPHLLQAISAGADGLLSKQISGDALLKALDLAMIGEMVIPSSCLRTIIKEAESLGRESAILPARAHSDDQTIANQTPFKMNGVHRLSCKEQLILRCLTQGASNKSIARELNIAEATVKVHVKGILRKFHVSNRTQAAISALNENAGPLKENIT